MTVDFAEKHLNGWSKRRDREFVDYRTSRTRVCVTVGMMTTGYDCEDVLNVVLARPIFSATDFIQIKGRGTRLFMFKHDATNRSAVKDGFALFDFFANCEFFETEFDYDAKLTLPQGSPLEGPEPGGGTGGTGGTIPSTFTNTVSERDGRRSGAVVGIARLHWRISAARRIRARGLKTCPTVPSSRQFTGDRT